MSAARRPYQIDAVRWFLARPDRRGIFAHATSAGKTLEAIDVSQALGASRILIVAPAVARPVWVREFQKWGAGEARPIIYGRGRTSGLSKAKTASRDAAYAANIQVVSYKLLKEMDADARDLVIFDEIHALRDPVSQQSRIAKAYLRRHSGIPVLGLSATLIPTEVKQLWNPLDTFWPHQWGRAQANGGISWDFQGRYCGREENEYGVQYRGAKDEAALAALAARLAPYIHRVTDRDVGPYLPPLHAEPLYVDEKRTDVDIAAEWYESAAADDAGVLAVIAYTRETAWAIAAKLDTEYVVTGEMSPEKRQSVLDAARALSAPAVLVCTSEAVRESVSLSFCKRALVLQWRTSPAQAIQLMGRFPRQDAESNRPCFIQYVVLPGDESRAEVLHERIAAIQVLMKADRKGEQLQEIFAPRPLTEERLEDMFAQMMGTMRLDAEWNEGGDDE